MHKHIIDSLSPSLTLTSDFHALRRLVDAADEEEQQHFLDVLHAVDLRRDARRQLLVEVVL